MQRTRKQVIYYLSNIKEDAKSKIEELTQNGKKALVRTGTVFALTAALSATTIACTNRHDVNTTNPSEEQTELDKFLANAPEYKTLEELNAEGAEITAQDVINSLEYYFYVIVKTRYLSLLVGHSSEELYNFAKERYDTLTVEFISITPCPIYYSNEGELTLVDVSFYNATADGKYNVRINYVLSYKGTEEPSGIACDIEKFNAILDAANTQTFKLLKEDIPKELEGYFSMYVDTEVYEPNVFDKNKLLKITDKNALNILQSYLEKQIDEALNNTCEYLDYEMTE